MPSHSFQVYIDESGDEGFVFLDGEKGSSRWFVLSAVIVRTSNDIEIVKCLQECRKLFSKPKDSS
ncbi:MAG TPA: DUF3800 domain-containing protein, partial [Opitutaceae bacterium]|nr:DUF3800 domain-containing protein [Opitutaceae bacterium]